MSEYGRCDICGKKTFRLRSKSYAYGFPCECCGRNGHYEVVRYCEKCKPQEPKWTRVVLGADAAKQLGALWKEQHNGRSNR